MKIHKGDTIVIVKGKDRGKVAKVLRAFPTLEHIVAEGVNVRKRHRRPRRGGEKGQIISFPAPFSTAQAKILCGKCGKATRVKYQGEGREKIRACKKCGEKI